MFSASWYVSAWSARYPRLASRLARALHILPGVRSIGEGVWSVPGEHGVTYTVCADLRQRRSVCDCADSLRGNRCKHRLACALWYRTHVTHVQSCESRQQA